MEVMRLESLENFAIPHNGNVSNSTMMQEHIYRCQKTRQPGEWCSPLKRAGWLS
jgi:hypothetical protein